MPLRIENAIDMHCHFGPDITGRKRGLPPPHIVDRETIGFDLRASVSGVSAAREAYESGHRAIVLKSHSFCSAQLAENLGDGLPGFTVFGGTCTDHVSGGLRVATVESALLLGARVVWLPTFDSCVDHVRNGTNGTTPIAVVDETGSLLPEVHEIALLCREFGAVLATGHTTAAEHHVIAKTLAQQCDILVTHAGETLAGPCLSPAQARELAELGATIELTAACCNEAVHQPPKSARAMADMIAQIGHENCTLSSDYGWSRDIPRPAPGLREFLERLWDVGVTEAMLTRMVADNPARLLRLD